MENGGVGLGEGGGGQCFLMMKDGEDSAAELPQCMYLVESSAETSVECS